MIKTFNLKHLAKTRPVIREVLAHSLNPDCYSKDNKYMQWELLKLVRAYQDDEKTDDYKLSSAEVGVIMMSCCETLRWLHRHPTHAWTAPTQRLLWFLLDNFDVPPEGLDYREEYKKWDPLEQMKKVGNWFNGK